MCSAAHQPGTIPKLKRTNFYLNPEISGYFIGVGAGKFLRVRRIFAQISPNFPEKNTKQNDIKKTIIVIQFSRKLSTTYRHH